MTSQQRKQRTHGEDPATWLEAQEPTQAPPWRADMGPQPQVFTWPHGDRPAFYVQVGTDWRYAPVGARYEWPDGRISYAVEVSVGERGSSRVFRTYWWPSPRLRRAHGSRVPASTSGRGGAYGTMPALHDSRPTRGRTRQRPGPPQHGG
ncbi:hypothetical protein ACOKM5_43025 [Streptomyces sp. BH097]|uniref:hypothetical protein n=1 Tax=unclassified Streptomyces TaxID=2593676 RepID=UPI003BB7D1E3